MQNVLLFLTPKSQVACLNSNFTIRQALEKMKYHRFTCVPMIDENGKYVGTITEGDILWYLNDVQTMDNFTLASMNILNVPRNRDNAPVNASATIDELFDKIIIQNFVPVVDDSGSFIGIITRKSVINYLINNQKSEDLSLKGW